MFAFLSIRLKSGREKLAGIYRYANEHRRQVKVFDGITTVQQLRTLFQVWNPSGCLVESSFLRSGLTVKAFADVPTVFNGLDPLRAGKNVFLVQQNAAEMIAPAVKEFLALQYPHAAYIGTPERFYWDESRRTCFRRAMSAHGLVPVEYRYSGHGLDTAEGFADFRRFLVGLPKPCTVLCAADYVAQSVIEVCNAAEIDIPGDLAVIGIDDDELICENTVPKLTSILPDFEGGGYLAAELLDEVIAHPGLPLRHLSYGPRALVIRESAERRNADCRIARAEAFIRAHVADRIVVSDVVSQMKCGRRFAERHFRRMTGMTILERIRAERMELALRHLRDRRCPIDAIPSLCGYSSLAYMKTVFKKKTGMTMREWRRNYLSAR